MTHKVNGYKGVKMPRNYWMVVTGLENFRITRRHGFKIQGLKSQHQRKMQRIEPGDRILYYLGAGKNFAATATAKSRYFEDLTPIWKNEGSANWNFRVQVQPDLVLDEFEFMDACQLAPRLDYVRKWQPEDWHLAFLQSSLHLLPKKDFMLIEDEMRKVKAKRPRRYGGGPAGNRRGPQANQPQAAPVGVPAEPETDGQAQVPDGGPPPEEATIDVQAQVPDGEPLPQEATTEAQAQVHDGEPPPQEATTEVQAQVHDGEPPPQEATTDEQALVHDGGPPPQEATTEVQAQVHDGEPPPQEATTDEQSPVHDGGPPLQEAMIEEQAQVQDGGPPPQEATTEEQAPVHDGGTSPQEATTEEQAPVHDDEPPPEQPPPPPQPEGPLPEPAPHSGPE